MTKLSLPYRRVLILVACLITSPQVSWFHSPIKVSAAFDKGCFSGFIGSKMEANLNRKKPPQLYLLGTKLRIASRASAATGQAYVGSLQRIVESGVLGGDKRFSLTPQNPETLIECDITGVESNEKWEDRTTNERKKVGEEQVWNEKKQKYETKDVYKEVPVTRRYQVLSGSFSISYKITEAQTRQSIDAAFARASFYRSYENGVGALTREAVEQTMLHEAAKSIYERLIPTSETVKVLLPQCDLKNLSRLGETGMWARMLEAFEKMPPFPKPKDDAYRFYGIGLAYEALAYQAEDLKTTLKMLEDAAVNYGKAFDAKLEEKYFREPQTRIETALKQYKTLLDQGESYSKKLKEVEQRRFAEELAQKSWAAQPSKTPANSQPGARGVTNTVKPTSTNPVKPGAWTNQDVIKLAKEGLSDSNLLENIKNAPAVQFDLSPIGLSDLLRNKVTNPVIAAMRLRQGQSAPSVNRRRRK